MRVPCERNLSRLSYKNTTKRGRAYIIDEPQVYRCCSGMRQYLVTNRDFFVSFYHSGAGLGRKGEC